MDNLTEDEKLWAISEVKKRREEQRVKDELENLKRIKGIRDPNMLSKDELVALVYDLRDRLYQSKMSKKEGFDSDFYDIPDWYKRPF